MISPRQSRSFRELKEWEGEDTPESQVEKYNELVVYLNFLAKNLSLQSNFNSQIVELDLPATTNTRIYHKLGVVPRYRLILRQEGNGLLTDIPLEWNERFVTIRNNGAVTVRATIALFKE